MGINSWFFRESQGLNFAVPASTLASAYSDALALQGYLRFPGSPSVVPAQQLVPPPPDVNEPPVVRDLPAPLPASSDPDRPILRRGPPSPSLPPTPPTQDDPDRPILRRGPVPPNREVPAPVGNEFVKMARDAAFEFDRRLPSFVCKQMVTRYQSVTRHPEWHIQDLLSYNLFYEDGKEDYRDPKINGRAVKAGADKGSGQWSSGEFGAVVVGLFHPSTVADFRSKGRETINSRIAKAYTFSVDKDHSRWRIGAGWQWILPAYKGTIWIDEESYRTLRVEMEVVNMPPMFVLDHAEIMLDYGFAVIEGQRILLPTHAEVLSCERGTYSCSGNAIDFREYKAVSGHPSGQNPPEPGGHPAREYVTLQPLFGNF